MCRGCQLARLPWGPQMALYQPGPVGFWAYPCLPLSSDPLQVVHTWGSEPSVPGPQVP